MNRYYDSIYGLHIKQFVDMKIKLGFKYRTFSGILSQMDRLAEETKEIAPGITKEFAKKWSERLPNESDFYRYIRVRILAQFSSYLCDLGIQSYIPKILLSQKYIHPSHLFSKRKSMPYLKPVMN